MKKILDLSGTWEGQAQGLGAFLVQLPGTLDTNKIGNADTANLATRLTRLHTYEGQVQYNRQITLPEADGKRLFLKIERSRELHILVNRNKIVPFEEGSLSTPWLYELTTYAGNTVSLTLLVDNAYTEWPRSSIIGASAATDETQTNWNGVLGELAIYETEPQFFEDLRIYPSGEGLKIHGKINGLDITEAQKRHLTLLLESEALEPKNVRLSAGQWQKTTGGSSCRDAKSDTNKKTENHVDDNTNENTENHVDGSANENTDENAVLIQTGDLPINKACKKWDEEEGNLYSIRVSLLEDADEKPRILTSTEATFGIRDFAVDSGQRLTINGRRFFLRGEANCCVFPQTGHPPMNKSAWQQILNTYASYGVNCMRFHSWCPPEAAFAAADEMGMMMQPELSQWNFKDAFADEKARSYYTGELFSILKMLANHPSFVMLTFGNELQYTEEGSVYAGELLDRARAYDSTRLYANSSNYHYGEEGEDPKSDFYTAMAYGTEMLRAISSPMVGHLNQEYPSACRTYTKTVNKILEKGKPVFEFEVGQYEVLPDFSEIRKFTGVTRAVNLEIIREKVQKQGILPKWENYVEATGELARIGYREEVEAALRTTGMSGLSMLGLQDFPGQGTALVGMLNSHLEPKPYNFARPERFREFFTSRLPLVYLEKYTYEAGESLRAAFKFANYGKRTEICGAKWTLLDGETAVTCGILPEKSYPSGELTPVGDITFDLPMSEKAIFYVLRVSVGETQNTYPLWVYPAKPVEYPENVTIVRQMTASVLQQISEGKTVFFDADLTKPNFKASVQSQFTTDFWSVGTFPEQEGTMGLLIEEKHPALAGFPTEMHSNYQWWPMSKGQAVLLPEPIQPILTVMDSYSKLRHMGLLFEVSFGKGRLMVSSMNLLGQQQYPECRHLLSCLLAYLSGVQTAKAPENPFPVQSITEEELRRILTIDDE